MQDRSLPLRCQSCDLASTASSGACPFSHVRKTAGEVLVEQGLIPAHVLHLRRGQVVLSSRSASGRQLSCAVRGPNTMLGLESVFARPVPYEVRALTDVTLCTLGVEPFRAWMGPLDSPLGTAFRFALEEGLRRANERQAVEGTALQRVARFLVQALNGSAGDDSPGVPQAVLASVLGMRAETLSRSLAELRARAALSPGRKIRVLDVQRLQLLAEEAGRT